MNNPKLRSILFVIKTSILSQKYILLGSAIETMVFIGIFYLSNKHNFFQTTNGLVHKSSVVLIPTLFMAFFVYSARVNLPLRRRLCNVSIMKSMGFYKKEFIKEEIAFLYILSFVFIIPVSILSWILLKNINVFIFMLILAFIAPLMSLFWYALTNFSYSNWKKKKTFFGLIGTFMTFFFVFSSLFYLADTVKAHLAIFYWISYINPLLSANVIYISLLSGLFHFYYIFPLVLWILLGIALYVVQFKKQKLVSNVRSKVDSFELEELTIEKRVLLKNVKFKISNAIIIGENGSGKTSLLNSIYEQYAHLNAYVSYLSPETENTKTFEQFYPLKMIENTIKNNKDISQNSIEIMSLLKSEFGEELKSKISKLSGGQKQLVNVLIMIFGDFDLLLIDELEKSLDKDKLTFLMELLAKYKPNAVKIFVTHDQELLNAYPDYKKILIKEKAIEEIFTKVLIKEVI